MDCLRFQCILSL